MKTKGQHWVLGYDFSDCSNDIAEETAKEIQNMQGKITLIHVYTLLPSQVAFTSLPGSSGPSSLDEGEEKILLGVEKHLEDAAKSLREKFPKLKVETLLREGDAPQEIIQVAKEKNATLIVVGSHGKKGIERLLLGSVAEKVVRESPINVLVIKLKHES